MGDISSENILTFDQLLRQRGEDEDQTPLLAYPKSRLGVDDYELINGKTLNKFVDGAAKSFLGAGFKPVYEETVVGIYGPSDLEYIITIFGLGRLGYTPFLLSTRLPATAVASLLTTCNSTRLFHSNNYTQFAESVSKIIPCLTLHQILARDTYDSPNHASTPIYDRPNVDPVQEQHRRYLVLHSSGSTGLPKPIHFTNKRLFVPTLTAQPCRCFQSVPFFHAHGLVTYVQAIFIRKTLYLMNGHVPQSHDTVTAAIKAAKPEVVWTVPYVLKLLAEKQDGIDVLKTARIVSSSGSRCPDDLGDLLVSQGVHLGLTFGSTETALILSSMYRPPEDKAWNYIRPPPHVKPYLIMRPVDGEICECIILDGHKAKVVTNSQDPPNSYHTSDLFVAHPTIENAWKFVGRLDDRVTLLNGEKVLPLPMEGRIRQDPLIREAVIFGVDRPIPGALLFRSQNAAQLDDAAFIDAVWPVVEEANSRAESFSQINKDMMIPLGGEVDCPTTDKSSIKRGLVYREFASVIDEAYERLENSQRGDMQLSPDELETWIVETFQSLGINVDPQSDFFTAGVDSLKAIQMRGLIMKNIDLNGEKCASMIVYDCGNAKKLAERLYAIRTGESAKSGDNEVEEMEKLIEKYSKFEKPATKSLVQKRVSKNSVVVLTGATGSLGSHILSSLIDNQGVSKIYCMIRTSTHETSTDRLTSALKERNMSLVLSKVIPLSVDLTQPDFALLPTIFETLQSETTHIIHCAWAVNFALSVQSFEPQLQALQNLISLSLSTPEPAQLVFCSSIGTAMATPTPTLIKSAPIPSLYHASPTGYSRSKLIGERILEAAVSEAGARGTILRIGQIVPAREKGSQLWNPNEAVPLMIRSAVAIGALPETVSGGGADGCSWLEADDLAESIVELSGFENKHPETENEDGSFHVYNLSHPNSFSWNKELLLALKTAGLEFEIVSWSEWLQRLSAAKDIKTNPSRKLLEFWEGQRIAEESKRGEVRFDISTAEAESPTLRRAKRVVDGDMVRKLLEAWKDVWQVAC